MNRDDVVKKLDETTRIMKQVLSDKSNDYANKDALSNFKTAGHICNISPELQCLSLIATKVARLGVLLSGAEPKNEPIEDSMLDLLNYSFLLMCIREDTNVVQ